MKDLNKLRLLAGVPIDGSIEITEKLDTGHITPPPTTRNFKLHENTSNRLIAKDDRTVGRAIVATKKSIHHLINAQKALKAIPRFEYNGIPNFMQDIDYALHGGDGNAGLLDLLAKFEQMQQDDSNKLFKESAESNDDSKSEETDKPNEDSTEKEESGTNQWWTVSVKHPKVDSFKIKAVSKNAATEKGQSRLDGMQGAGKILRVVKLNQRPDDVASTTKFSKQLDNMSEESRQDLVNRAYNKQKREGNLTPIEQYIVDMTEFTPSKPVKEDSEVYSDNNYDSFMNDPVKPVNVVDGSANDEQVWDQFDPKDTKDESPAQLQTMDQQDNSPQDKSGDDLINTIKIPENIKSALKKEIDQARKEAKTLTVSNKEASIFYDDLANAFEDLLNLLKDNSVYSFKQAQVYATTLMGPMLHKIPTDVWKFLTNGGQTRSLKSYMTDVSNDYPKVTATNN